MHLTYRQLFNQRQADAVRALRGGEYEAAHRETVGLEEFVSQEPGLRELATIQGALGDLWVLLGDYPRALQRFSDAIAAAPDNATYRFNRGAVNRILGNLRASEDDYDEVIRLSPGDGYAYLNRTELRRQTTTRNHVAELERVLGQAPMSWRHRVPLHYALAKEYEDLGDHRNSWRHLSAGSALRRRHLSYNLQIDLQTVEWLRQAFPAASEHTGNPSTAPIFILGMPRTGSTLIERILGNHPAIRQGGELQDFGLSIVSLVRRRLGRESNRRELIFESAKLDYDVLGAEYLRRTRWLTRDKIHFTDKLPLNYLYVGLIARALPGATIVHVTRHPLAVCYGVFKVLFEQGYPFSYDLKEVAEYYLGYVRLMEHWKATLGSRIVELKYETLVRDPIAESKRLVAPLQLPWKPEYADPMANKSPSATASAVQVRSPIDREHIEQWRNYERELTPVADRLREAGLVFEQ